MPTISMFYGIIVRMYAEKDGRHNLPHIHVGVGGQEAVVDLSGNVLEGEIPKTSGCLDGDTPGRTGGQLVRRRTGVPDRAVEVRRRL